MLDEGVPDAVDERHPARALDRLRHGPARTHVVDHLRARLLAQDRLREQRGDEVAGDELAGVVHEEAAIRVAVEGDAEVGALLERLRDDERPVLGQERVRLVVRERSVWLEVAGHRPDRQPLEHGREHRARHPVRRVDHDLERRDRRDVHERQHLLDEAGPDVVWLDRPDRTRPVPGTGRGRVAHVQKARLAADRERAPPHDLEARVVARIVRGRDREAALEAELADRVVEHLRPDHPEVEDVGAALGSAAHRRGGHRRRRQSHVAPHRDPARLEVLDVRASDRVCALLVHLRRVQAPDVVRLEDLGVEHGAGLYPGTGVYLAEQLPFRTGERS